MAPLPIRKLGSQGAEASAQGLGLMGMSAFYTAEAQPEEESLKTIARAVELGVTMMDTADMYGFGKNEQLLAKALKGRRDDFFVATKFANVVNDKGEFGVRGDPEHVRNASEKSLKDLGIETIDLYYQHRTDPKTPIEETVTAMAELVKAGKVRYLGLSEVSPENLRKAHAVHPISAVQLEWSLWERSAEADVIPVCRELGIGIVCYSPLGRGFLTGQIKSHDDIPDDDFRKHAPRFSRENFPKNIELVRRVEDIAKKYDATAGQVALAWLHAQGDDVFPIPGTKQIKRLEENVGGFELSQRMSKADLDELSSFFHMDAAVGQRYPEAHMASVHDSRKAAKA
jgi:aryl-alcohol dehydrogenase-like predicted oxidoreductase